MKERVEKAYREYPQYSPIPNLWLGVTAENQEQADKRIPVLLETPAAKRFVSIEPMLGSVDLRKFFQLPEYGPILDQVFLGAETGPGKRPMNQEWAWDIANECAMEGIPFFGKKDSNGDPLKIDGEVIRELAE